MRHNAKLVLITLWIFRIPHTHTQPHRYTVTEYIHMVYGFIFTVFSVQRTLNGLVLASAANYEISAELRTRQLTRQNCILHLISF